MENASIYCLLTLLCFAHAQEQDTRELPGCKCESFLVFECCRNTEFSALLNNSENIAFLDKLSKPFYIVLPSLNRRRVSIVTPDVEIALLNITGIRKNDSRMTPACVSSGCGIKINTSRRKDANCQFTICNGSVIEATFELDSRRARLARLKCVGRTCGNVLYFDVAQELAAQTNTQEEMDTETKANSIIVTVQAGVMDTIWLVVLLGGTTVAVLALIGVVFACLTRRDRRRKALSVPTSSASSTNWHFRPTPTFVAAVDEFYRAAMTPDAEDDAASVSDEDEDDEVMERSSAQRTIKFSAAPTFAPTPSRLNGETLEARHALVSSTNATPVAPVKSILKKNGRSLSNANRNRTDAAVDTAHPQSGFLLLANPTLAASVGQLGLPSAIDSAIPAANESACVSSSSSSYSLVECADKAVGVTESELDCACGSTSVRAEIDTSNQLAHLFVTPSGQLVQLVPASPSPSTNLSPASTSNLPDPNLLAPQPASASVSASVSVCESSECDCECESQSASAKTPKADDDVELDAVSLSDLDLFKLSFQPAPPKPATIRTPTYLPNPAALNRLSSLASDSENPSAHDTPSPSTVAASTPTSTHTRGQAKLELHNANLQLSLNIVSANDAHNRRQPPLEPASASSSDWAPLASAKAALVVSAGLQRQRTDALWQTRQPWMKNSADRFEFDLS